MAESSRITRYFFPPYTDLLGEDKIDLSVNLQDHMGGFSPGLRNALLDHLQAHARGTVCVTTNYPISTQLARNYPALDLRYEISPYYVHHVLGDYRAHPPADPRHFLCSFNGSAHVSRKLLVSALHTFGFFDDVTCSKNFEFDTETLDGHLADLAPDRVAFNRKFFINPGSPEFFSTIKTFGYEPFDHANNVRHLEHKLTGSFLHLISEVVATSHYPFVTEKVLYSIVTRGLFLAWGQPGWHQHLEQYYGFRKFDRIFDYGFDSIQDPIERLLSLLGMLSKFSRLSTSDWIDLREMEADTIEYNIDWYFSGNYLKRLRGFAA